MEENYKLAKWLDGEMTDAELKEFQADPDFPLYEKIKLYSSQLETPKFDENKILNTVLETKKQTPKVVTLKPNWFMRIAAVLVIGFGLFFAFNTFTPTTELAENGKQTTFLLPDNSEVILNSGSQIDFKKWNWDSNRKLKLNGEAYFKVAKGKKFEVNTNLGKVSVLGTQFNVKARKDRFDVVCFEGKVKVNFNTQEVILTPGQMVSFEGNEKIVSKTISDAKPVWLSKELSFEKEKLTAVLEEIQRQYNVTIDAKNIKSDQLFTGKIPTNNIDIALKTITSIYHLKYSKSTNSNYVIEEIK
ncbi:FecR family protein [Flavobacterium aquatile]|uniref:Iron dicitrate transport regulator FecR n=1 Tax=Flavobacterium aquatile LMG 4008 = ATCC 11947 TaxID=1453498 RepID=A0A095V064_9FLAO|nr:FecR family protein [Flavobacterium aquatile]KGD68215.1 iron dicitrate transport regulator FecR [Flavobacterium aquatile LMG 4008 = ATCC 11947]OXA68850.1 iron dicitrate transport regulator FecR [Flavobacterium aquatile LMG 4008 = ATCC 11947]GEC77312.1 iron dicitrate transporter FecR [Flavobacterium aquatile]